MAARARLAALDLSESRRSQEWLLLTFSAGQIRPNSGHLESLGYQRKFILSTDIVDELCGNASNIDHISTSNSGSTFGAN